ncbi:hypothetical protein GDO86_020034 [Hymenochirus boettgeri]|uniref:Uncharacterized protein n=1 Tax=Hymenochirus boettgeri TaxID=247094 RepID=A0A8T2ICN3_9PIPI|nr:hypothetical protein GDO86_020034 [Hymenochirus boettgeri]
MKVKIQFSQAQEEICNRFTWEVKRIHSKYRKTIAIADALCNPVTIYGNYENRAQVSENGSLLLHRVKTKDSGEYFITVDDLERRKWFEHKITLQVKGPSNNQNSKKGGNSVN